MNNNKPNVNISDPQIQKWMIQEMELAMERLNVSLNEVQSWLTKKAIPSDPNKLTLYQCISNYAEMIYTSNNTIPNPFLLPLFSQTQQNTQIYQKQTIKIKPEPISIDLTNEENEIEMKPIQTKQTINQIISKNPKNNNIIKHQTAIATIPLPPINLPLLPTILLPNISQTHTKTQLQLLETQTQTIQIQTHQPTSLPLPLPNLQLSPLTDPLSDISPKTLSPINDIKMNDITNINITPIINTQQQNINPYLYAFPPSINSKPKQLKIKKDSKNKKHRKKRKHVRHKKPKVKPEHKKSLTKVSKVKHEEKIKTPIDKVRAIKSRGGGGIVKPMKDKYYRLISRMDIEGKLEYMKYNGTDLAHCYVKRTDKIEIRQNGSIEIIISEGHKCKTMNCKYPHLYSQKCHWKRHALTEHCNRKFTCKFCTAVFRQQTQRKEHIINKHTQLIVKWLCPYGCNGVFSQFRGVVRHVKFDRKCDAREKYFDQKIINKIKNKWDNDIMKALLKFNTNTNTNEKYMITNDMKINIRKKIKNMFQNIKALK